MLALWFDHLNSIDKGMWEVLSFKMKIDVIIVLLTQCTLNKFTAPIQHSDAKCKN